MKTTLISAIAVAALVQGCGSAPVKQTETELDHPAVVLESEIAQQNLPDCERNFSYRGSSTRGRTFRSNLLIQGVDRNKAYQNMLDYVADKGWTVELTNKERGVISAEKDEQEKKPTQLDLDLNNHSKAGTVTVTMAHRAWGEAALNVERVKKEFCDIADLLAKQ